MRLTYDRVTQTQASTVAGSGELSLPDMLHYRDDHSLAAYVRGEIRQRFDHLACETVSEFQMAS